MKGTILFSAESEEELLKLIENSKRLRIPKILNDVSEDSSVDTTSMNNVSGVDKENLKRTKDDRKELKKTKESNKRFAMDDIVNTYVNDEHHSDSIISPNDSYSSYKDYDEHISTSTPERGSRNVQSRTNEGELLKAIDAYKLQLTFYKEKAEFFQTEARTWKKQFDDLSSNKNMNNETACAFCAEHKQDAETFVYLDKLYGYSSTSVNHEESTTDGKVILSNGVQCNSKAYIDSLKAKEPIEAVKLLSVGIYGYNDLATRCVREQKNTRNQILLEPKRSEAIERVFYRYLRLNRYPVHLLKKELGKCSIYHHNAIGCARSRIKRQKDVEESLHALEQQNNEFDPTILQQTSTDT